MHTDLAICRLNRPVGRFRENSDIYPGSSQYQAHIVCVYICHHLMINKNIYFIIVFSSKTAMFFPDI